MEPLFHPPIVSVLPFASLLAGIAAFPLICGRWWERHGSKLLVMLVLAGPVAVWLLLRDPAALVHTTYEYLSFLALLGSLFVIAGGIHVSGDLRATPASNVGILGAGALLANLIGTTGASMVMIRLLLRTNQQRKNVAHLPFFFILIVSNCAGLLTPLGDPPLFLGYLRGVPFTWTLRLWPVWLVAMVYLLGLFYVLDRRAYRSERRADLARDIAEVEPIRIQGGFNGLLLVGVVAAVFAPSPWREIAMLTASGLSYALGPRKAREDNGFTFGPIIEVALLFAGIFVTMVPALKLLEQNGSGLGLSRPWHFFLTSGALSSVLDNAPTYLTFLSAAQGLPLAREIVGVPHSFLAAISCGSVFMGANTYIGNGPNFMVKAIADASGYRTVSFMRHAAAAVLVLGPLYVLTAIYVSL